MKKLISERKIAEYDKALSKIEAKTDSPKSFIEIFDKHCQSARFKEYLDMDSREREELNQKINYEKRMDELDKKAVEFLPQIKLNSYKRAILLQRVRIDLYCRCIRYRWRKRELFFQELFEEMMEGIKLAIQEEKVSELLSGIDFKPEELRPDDIISSFRIFCNSEKSRNTISMDWEAIFELYENSVYFLGDLSDLLMENGLESEREKIFSVLVPEIHMLWENVKLRLDDNIKFYLERINDCMNAMKAAEGLEKMI